ncbi:hypothetical protein LJ739_00545 [Aestuariibacter halophilus]|uniref:Holin n=1 Tax=Fluctibacter halophilus TaxID=226011 RepID=A0ABS8G2B9_9ALTE|nr:hypothetical protein [Aestuariibacter halophilus]MCC2614727.1 hypothetical protein [Aestuariibacter halophilus]
MTNPLLLAFSAAFGALVHQFIRYGLQGIDWLAPVVVGVVTVLIYSALTSVFEKPRQTPHNGKV